jgi:tRNA (guanine-N7-)-methyltransferase
MDAENLLHVFAPNEVAQIYLNFSDPWPKKRTAKRRLTSPQFLQRYRQILKNDAHILLKSDNFGFYQYSLMCFNQDDQFAFEKLQLDLYRDLPNDNIATEFENKFIEEGKLIHFLNVKFKGENE